MAQELSGFIGKTYSYYHNDGITPALGTVQDIRDGQFVMDNGHTINASWLINNGDEISQDSLITDIVPEDEFDYVDMGIEQVDSDVPIAAPAAQQVAGQTALGDPVIELINKLKTTETFIDIPIKVNLVSKEIFSVMDDNFEDGVFMENLVTKILSEINPEDLKKVISDTIKKHYDK